MSLGTGQFPVVTEGTPHLNLSQAVNGIIEAVSGTELVHHAVEDLMPAHKYFRFNPQVERIFLDENDAAALAGVQVRGNY